ncbi:MAG: metallophosphoesterase family protein [Candidatus Hydrogenedentes bacterium]|nr:metallophosphoesterase family protein [Candidatus Hydrogenedentota bacterium]
MKIGIVSDSHGNLPLLHQAAAQITGHFCSDLVFHLGDDYEDGRRLSGGGVKIRIVPGLQCREYFDLHFSKVHVEEVDGLRIAAAHTREELAHHAPAAQIYLFGHTHAACIELKAGRIFLNPGHLKASMDRGYAPSFAILETAEAVVSARVYEMNGAIRLEQQVPRSALQS